MHYPRPAPIVPWPPAAEERTAGDTGQQPRTLRNDRGAARGAKEAAPASLQLTALPQAVRSCRITRGRRRPDCAAASDLERAAPRERTRAARAPAERDSASCGAEELSSNTAVNTLARFPLGGGLRIRLRQMLDFEGKLRLFEPLA